jgi:hypothetical protein
MRKYAADPKKNGKFVVTTVRLSREVAAAVDAAARAKGVPTSVLLRDYVMAGLSGASPRDVALDQRMEQLQRRMDASLLLQSHLLGAAIAQDMLSIASDATRPSFQRKKDETEGEFLRRRAVSIAGFLKGYASASGTFPSAAAGFFLEAAQALREQE